MSRLRSLFESLPFPVLADGAWGTEFQKRGLPLGQAPDSWNLDRPAEVEAVARSYVEAGSQVILTNTFRANPPALGAMGLANRTTEINREGARISRKAAGSSVRVFGSIGPLGKSLAKGEIEPDEAAKAIGLQVRSLAEGGVDALLFETCLSLDEARIAVETARPTGLPVIVSFFFMGDEQGDRTIGGETPEAVARTLADLGVDGVGANCGDVTTFARLGRRLNDASGLPVWLKPNAGIPKVVDGRAVYTMTPEVFASETPALVQAGASFIGGCCGAGPRFIRAVARTLAQ